MNILRLTKHKATEEQIFILKKVFGEDINIIEYTPYIKSGKEVVQLVEKYDIDIVEVVLPLNLLNEVVTLLKDRVIIIRAIMERYKRIRGLVENVIFKFSYYEIIKDVKIVTSPLLIERVV